MQEARRNNAESLSAGIVLATIIASALPFMALGTHDGRFYRIFPASDFLAYHNVVELFSVVVSFSIFGIGWYTFSASGNTRSLLLASAFALVAYFDLFHTLSFVGMPIFISPSSTNKSIFSWEAARLLSALGLLAAAFAPRASRHARRDKIVLAVSALLMVAVATTAILYYENAIPPMFVPSLGLTPLKIGIEYVVILLFGLALFGLWKQPLGERDGSHTMMLCSIVLAIASELAFTLYKNSYDSFSLLGHAFKLLAFFLLYRSVFIVAVTRPYSRLRESEEALRGENEGRLRSETSLEQTNRELTVLHECNQAIARGADEVSLLASICRILCVSGGYRMAWVGYAVEDEHKTLRPMSFAGHEDGYLEAAKLSWGDGVYGQGPTGTCIRTGQSRYVQDFATDISVLPWRDLALPRGYRSSISLPLKDKEDRTFGAFTIYSSLLGAFTQTEIRLLEELADDLSFGVLSLRARVKNREDDAKIRDALREKEVLLRELHHRTRNNMQVISSMLCLEEEKLESAEDRRIFDDVGMRIQSMALVHQKLYQAGDLSRIELRDYVESLCALFRESTGRGEEEVVFNFDDMARVEVLIDTAVPLGIVLNELLANAFRHAFPGDRKGRISISLNRDEEGAVCLGFSDDGVGFDGGSDPRARGKTGFMLIFELVTLQLGGQIECSARKGTSWYIRFLENRYGPRV